MSPGFEQSCPTFQKVWVLFPYLDPKILDLNPEGPSTHDLGPLDPKTISLMVLGPESLPTPPNVPLLRALRSLLDGIWGVLEGSWGVLVNIGYLDPLGSPSRIYWSPDLEMTAILAGRCQGSARGRRFNAAPHPWSPGPQ